MRAGHSRERGNLVSFVCLCFRAERQEKRWIRAFAGMTVSRRGARHPQATAQLAYHSAMLSHACWSFPRTRESSFFRVLVFQSGAPRKALDPRLRGDDGEPWAGQTIRTTTKAFQTCTPAPLLRPQPRSCFSADIASAETQTPRVVLGNRRRRGDRGGLRSSNRCQGVPNRCVRERSA